MDLRLSGLFFTALTMTGCGAASDEENRQSVNFSEANLVGDIAEEASPTVRIDASFKYEEAEPRIVNGRPVRDHRYWSCVDKMTVEFSRPMRLPTVLGNVRVTNSYSGRRAPILTVVSNDLRRFQFGFGPKSLCDDYRQLRRVVIDSDARAVDGSSLTCDLETQLSFPPGRDVLPESVSLVTALPITGIWGVRQEASPCLGSSCISVTPERLNAAMMALRTWNSSDRTAPVYQGSGLKLLPLEFLMTPFASVNRRRHYGNSDLIYALRRASRFIQMLMPDVRAIPVADMSNPDGTTPNVDGIALHPRGSHEGGSDVDVAYITAGSGHEAGAAWHPERNFWFTFGLLQSTGVDFIMTAYARELQTLAANAYAKGLVNATTVGRFRSLMQNGDLNHDKHLHVAVHNRDNAGRSLRFAASDDAYACYLALRPDGAGGTHNFCESP